MSYKESVGRFLFGAAAISVLLAACTPKILIGQTPVYASEIVLLLAPVLLLTIQPKSLVFVQIPGAIKLIYIFYLFILLGCLVTATINSQYSWSSFLLLGKRVLYHVVLMLLAFNGVRLLGERRDLSIDRFLRVLVILGLVPLLFSIGELIAFATLGFSIAMENLTDFSQSSYSPTLFAVGFTGRAIGLGGFYLVGSSSINYGILNAGLSFLAFNYYIKSRRIGWLMCVILYSLGVVLTMSSTALVVLLLGFSVYFVLKGNRPLRAVLLPLSGIMFVMLIANLPVDQDGLFAFGDFVKTLQGVIFGTEGAAHVNVRLQTIERALTSIGQHPYVIWTGAGIGDYIATTMNARDPLIESFAIDALLNAGALGFAALVVSFVLLGLGVRRALSAGGAIGIAATATVMYAPGLLFANTISGNSIQSEFVGGLLFMLLAICYGATQECVAERRERFSYL